MKKPRDVKSPLKIDMKHIPLAALVIILLSGCSRNEEHVEKDASPYFFQPKLETPSVAFYLEGSKQQDPYGDLLGCGVLACALVNNEKRYFVATAAHVIQNVRGPLQIGIKADVFGENIRRLHIPQGGIEWKQPDLEHDIIIGDITDSMEDMRGVGVIIECIDIDSIGAKPMVLTEETFSDVGVATSNQYERLAIGPFSHATVVCADIGSTRLVNAATAEWSSPFIRKEATLIATYVHKQHAILDSDGNPTSEPITLTVNNYLGDINAGNSGAPVYIRGVDGREYFAGIINGKVNGEFFAVPVDFIKEYVANVYGGKQKTDSFRYRSIYFAESLATNAWLSPSTTIPKEIPSLGMLTT